MTGVFFTCILMGVDFNPAELEKDLNLRFSSKRVRGEQGLSGKFKGKVFDAGGGEVVLDEAGLDLFLEVLIKNKQLLKAKGVSEIWLTLNMELHGQCNWEFTSEQLRQIVDLNVQLSVTCF